MAQRTIEADQQAVHEALGSLHIDGLHIELLGDRIYLRGITRSYGCKHAAMESAEAAAPGYIIENELRVAQSEFPDDAHLALQVRRAIAALGPAIAGKVRVEASDGVVHLHGAVTREEQRAVEQAVWRVGCVSRVRCHLTTHDVPETDLGIGRALEEYIQRAMNLRPGVVSADYLDGTASLSGFVESDTKARAIEDLIRWHDRVDDVVNNLRVGVPSSLAPPAAR